MDPDPITRNQLNIIERIVDHVYHKKREEYGTLASQERRERALKDCKAADAWLAVQYAHLDSKERKKP